MRNHRLRQQRIYQEIALYSRFDVWCGNRISLSRSQRDIYPWLYWYSEDFESDRNTLGSSAISQIKDTERMTKARKLKLCDWTLVFTTAFILASSMQLEATGSRGTVWVWTHVVIGCLFFANVIWHLYLHFNWKSWVQRLRKQKSPVTRWLAILAFLTLVSALFAVLHWIGSYVH